MDFKSRFALLLLLASSLFVDCSLGELTCEELPTDSCAFAIASSGRRCVLENTITDGGKTVYECRTSQVAVYKMSGYIETDQCIKACKVDRKMVGISSDALLERSFTAKLCSSSCYNNCPNIVDLYDKLAAGEGVSLPDLCHQQRINPRRAMMMDLMSSGAAAAPLSDTYNPPEPAPSAPVSDFATPSQSPFAAGSPMSDPVADAPTPNSGAPSTLPGFPPIPSAGAPSGFPGVPPIVPAAAPTREEEVKQVYTYGISSPPPLV